MSRMIFEVEHTDTFGGEANYAWVHRYEFEADDDTTDLALVRRAKKLCGVSGQRSTTESWGDMIAIRMTHSCQIIFITFKEEL